MQRFMANPVPALARLLQPPDADDAVGSDEQTEQPEYDSPSEAPTASRPAGLGRASQRPVRLWILSDLHLEAVPYPQAFRPRRPEFDVLVVAGDVWEGDSCRALEVVAALADGRAAVFVMGNHESWGELQRQRVVARRTADRLGITLLDDSEVGV